MPDDPLRNLVEDAVAESQRRIQETAGVRERLRQTKRHKIVLAVCMIMLLVLAFATGAKSGALWTELGHKKPIPVDAALVKPFYDQGGNASLGRILTLGEGSPCYGMTEFQFLKFYSVAGITPRDSLAKYTGTIIGVNKGDSPPLIDSYPHLPGQGPLLTIHIRDGQLTCIEGSCGRNRRFFVDGKLRFYEDFTWNSGPTMDLFPRVVCQIDRDGQVVRHARWQIHSYPGENVPPWDAKYANWRDYFQDNCGAPFQSDQTFSKGQMMVDLVTTFDGRPAELTFRRGDKVEFIHFAPDGAVQKRSEGGDSVLKSDYWDRQEKTKPQGEQSASSKTE